MRILLTGSNGFLGQKVSELLFKHHDNITILGLSKSANRNPYLRTEDQFIQADLTDFSRLLQILHDFAPTHILHTAALTHVEQCEQNPTLAKFVNIESSAVLAEYAANFKAHLTFISTDFVFDGRNGPYRETDPTNPVNNYGKTKELAEQIIQQKKPNAAILRTILVYGIIPDRGRSNVVLWAKSNLESNTKINVVNDHWRMPTWVDDLAQACIRAMELNAGGIYHISGEEMMSVYETVLKVADFWKLDKALINPIPASTIEQADNRPRTTGFVLDKAKNELHYTPTPFLKSLAYIWEQLNNTK